MENLGQTITDYRKKLNLTQKDLGEKLNVSPQAVSKWENGQAEPDASTIIKLCEIFKISTDELLGNTPPADEVAATTAAPAAEVPAEPVAPQPQIIRETVVEQKIIAGYCEMCKKPVEPGNSVIISRRDGVQHLYCRECNEKRLKDETRTFYSTEYNTYKREIKRSLIFGPLIGAGATLLFCLVFMLIVKLDPLWMTALLAVGVFVGWTAFGIQVFWEDSVVLDIFMFFLKSFTFPGVIFTLDLDGIIFLILVKIGGAIICAILSVIFFLIGLLFTPVASVFILPFAALKRGFEGRKLRKATEE